MSTLFDPSTHESFVRRVATLGPESPRGWGKMTPAQALRHCAIGLEAATGDATLKRNLAAKLIGPLFKGWLLSPKPFSQNSPTHPQLVMSESCDFGAERTRLLAAMAKFHAAGPAAAARYEHAFVGRVTGEEWGRLQYKHVDHHLRQFGA